MKKYLLLTFIFFTFFNQNKIFACSHNFDSYNNTDSFENFYENSRETFASDECSDSCEEISNFESDTSMDLDIFPLYRSAPIAIQNEMSISPRSEEEEPYISGYDFQLDSNMYSKAVPTYSSAPTIPYDDLPKSLMLGEEPYPSDYDPELESEIYLKDFPIHISAPIIPYDDISKSPKLDDESLTTVYDIELDPDIYFNDIPLHRRSSPINYNKMPQFPDLDKEPDPDNPYFCKNVTLGELKKLPDSSSSTLIECPPSISSTSED